VVDQKVNSSAGSEGGCLGCGAALPPAFLDLGATPLANAYVPPEHAGRVDEVFPLAVVYCERCQLVQLTNIVAPERLFSEYLYFSSYSESFLAHASEMADSLAAKFALNSGSRVIEIGSNDGYLLQFFKQRGVPVLGVEPAANIAEEASRRGIPTLNRFFGPDVTDKIRDSFGVADVIIGNNVLAHVPRLNNFLSAVNRCLNDRGTAVFEFPYLPDLLQKVEFDTIYHEHVFYFTVTALTTLARRAGLEVTDVAHQTVHGGSLRLEMRRRGVAAASHHVEEFLDREERFGLGRRETYLDFGRKVDSVRRKFVGMLQQFKHEGKRLAAYGAPAKGNTLLNYCGIGVGLVEFTVDRNPRKQNLLLPGSHIPIKAPEMLIKERPDYVVILPWNISEEIIGRQLDYLAGGGKFIIPVPWPRVVGA
jgi:SAM-dependent methyltransferase